MENKSCNFSKQLNKRNKNQVDSKNQQSKQDDAKIGNLIMV